MNITHTAITVKKFAEGVYQATCNTLTPIKSEMNMKGHTRKVAKRKLELFLASEPYSYLDSSSNWDQDLFLVVTGEWYDMLESRVKLDEYRAITPYWIRRLITFKDYPKEFFEDGRNLVEDVDYDINENGYSIEDVLKAYYGRFKSFQTVTFQHAYATAARRMTFEFKGIDVGLAVPAWSGNMVGKFFRIKTGNKVATRPKDV